MNKTFTRLSQANVDHYNDHPAIHTALTVAYGIVAVVGINKMAKWMAKEDPALRSGRYAK